MTDRPDPPKSRPPLILTDRPAPLVILTYTDLALLFLRHDPETLAAGLVHWAGSDIMATEVRQRLEAVATAMIP